MKMSDYDGSRGYGSSGDRDSLLEAEFKDNKMKQNDYWDKKEKYQRLTRYSGTCWHALYTEEKKKRKLAEKDRDKWEALSQYYGRLLELD